MSTRAIVPFSPTHGSHTPAPSKIDNHVYMPFRTPRLSEHSTQYGQLLPSVSEVILGKKFDGNPVPEPSGLLVNPEHIHAVTVPPHMCLDAYQHASTPCLHAPSSISNKEGIFSTLPSPSQSSWPSFRPGVEVNTVFSKKYRIGSAYQNAQRSFEPRRIDNGYPEPRLPPPQLQLRESRQLPPAQVPYPQHIHYPIARRRTFSSISDEHGFRDSNGMHQDVTALSDWRKQHCPVSVDQRDDTYQEYLNQVQSSAQAVYTFAAVYGAYAQEKGGKLPEHGRLPTEKELKEMFSNLELIKTSMEQVRGVVLLSTSSQAARGRGNTTGLNGEERDNYLHQNDNMAHYNPREESTQCIAEITPPSSQRNCIASQITPITALPDRCHNCNKTKTPEWRRGPDGARTLCNACGLLYAKLERKRQLGARSK